MYQNGTNSKKNTIVKKKGTTGQDPGRGSATGGTKGAYGRGGTKWSLIHTSAEGEERKGKQKKEKERKRKKKKKEKVA